MDEVEEELKMKGLLVLPGSPKTILSLSSKGHSLSDPIKTILCIVVDLQGTLVLSVKVESDGGVPKLENRAADEPKHPGPPCDSWFSGTLP